MMIGDTGIIEDHCYPRRGRPPGTGYLAVDAPLLARMQEMLDRKEANSPTAAAKRLADMAYGYGTWESKVKRLVRSFRDE